ncbi:MAG: hypothetical protein JSV31_15585 [Desulfobacterales bacterium]|nr:MAG: hypothetical protein JSV31_15585 [Desulfobacterales bacterium]
MKSSIKLIMKPKWDEIEKIRNKSSNFLVSQGISNNSIQALTMVISELVENSVKYGKFLSPKNTVIINIHIDENIVTTEVINPVDNTVFKHLKKLDKTIQWIRGFQNPLEAYTERLRVVSKKPLNDEDSGLGLVRIAYEGKAILDFFVSEDNFLNVSALSNS